MYAKQNRSDDHKGYEASKGLLAEICARGASGAVHRRFHHKARQAKGQPDRQSRSP